MENKGIKEITEDDLLKILAKESLGAGGFGEGFVLDDDLLFKLYYKDLGQERYNIDFDSLCKNVANCRRRLENIRRTVLYKLMSLHGIIKNAAVPRELVFLHGGLVGSIIDRAPGKTLHEVMKEVDSVDLAKTIKGRLDLSYEELADFRIFTRDVKADNVFIGPNLQVPPQDLKAIIIDIDDKLTSLLTRISQLEAGRRKDMMMQLVNEMFEEEVNRNPMLRGKRFK